jgi:predicted dehydrogenase
MSEKESGQGTTRREFLKVAGLTAAGLALTSVAKSKTYAVASGRVIGANDRILIGHIGCGGQAMAHIRILKQNAEANNTQSIAVCDVYDNRTNDARTYLGLPESAGMRDYRKLLENKDIDAVWIATPEHWHFQQAMDAADAGKHIYLEKPMTRHLDEALKLHDKIKETGVVLQVGSQGCTDAKWHKAGEIVKAGTIGKVVWCQGSYCRNNPDGEWNYTIDPKANESNLDWSMWLGPAPKIPWSPERYFRWRKYWDYSAGILSDLFPHRLHPLMIAIGGGEYPTRVLCSGGQFLQHDREVADTTHVLADFPGGYTMVVAGSTINELGLDDIVRGNKANLFLGGGGKVTIRPERPYADQIDAAEEAVTGPGEDIGEHQKNFLECVRDRTKTPNCDVELATKVQTVVSLAEMSYREKKAMLFDPEKRQIVNS